MGIGVSVVSVECEKVRGCGECVGGLVSGGCVVCGGCEGFVECV